MTDIHSKAVRSYNMSMIKGKNTKPEMIVRSFLFKNGFRYRINDKNLSGKPDIVLPKYKTIIFVNGCFWHGHIGCKLATIPKTKTEWWANKINRTIIKDQEVINELSKSGWQIITIWGCMLKKKNLEHTLTDLLLTLTKG